MLLDLLQKRRSVRKYARRAVEPEKVDILLEALLRAPSSRGRRPWEFIVVDEPELLKKLGTAKAHGAAFIADAPLAVVVAGDPERCDVWIEDCAIAAILLQMAAESIGLGSCWVQIRRRQRPDGGSAEDYLKSLLHLPAGQRVLSIVGIGHPADPLPGHARESLPWGKIHRNRFAAPK
ncbi:MAG: nitroreductase family protein [Desulfuromonadales bacterium]